MVKEYVTEKGTLQNLRSDNNRVKKTKFNKFSVKNKINHEFTVPENPKQNDVAESYNRTVIESARCLLIESPLPKIYRVRAVDTASFVRNLVSRNKDDLRVFVSLAYVKNRNAMRTGKFDPKAQKCVFLGYVYNSTAYVIQNLGRTKVIEVGNVMFNDKILLGLKYEPKNEMDVFFSNGLRPKRKM